MNVRCIRLVWEYYAVTGQEFDQMKYASESLLPQITIRIKMNLSQLRMWSVVAKQI